MVGNISLVYSGEEEKTVTLFLQEILPFDYFTRNS